MHLCMVVRNTKIRIASKRAQSGDRKDAPRRTAAEVTSNSAVPPEFQLRPSKNRFLVETIIDFIHEPTGLSRRKQGFETPTGRQRNQFFRTQPADELQLFRREIATFPHDSFSLRAPPCLVGEAYGRRTFRQVGILEPLSSSPSLRQAQWDRHCQPAPRRLLSAANP
jgi:hypothetical protein